MCAVPSNLKGVTPFTPARCSRILTRLDERSAGLVLFPFFVFSSFPASSWIDGFKLSGQFRDFTLIWRWLRERPVLQPNSSNPRLAGDFQSRGRAGNSRLTGHFSRSGCATLWRVHARDQSRHIGREKRSSPPSRSTSPGSFHPISRARIASLSQTEPALGVAVTVKEVASGRRVIWNLVSKKHCRFVGF